MTDVGKLTLQFSSDGPVRKLLFYEEKNMLITVTTTMMLMQHTVSAEGETVELLKVSAVVPAL